MSEKNSFSSIFATSQLQIFAGTHDTHYNVGRVYPLFRSFKENQVGIANNGRTNTIRCIETNEKEIKINSI